MIEPKEIEVAGIDGSSKTFIISKVPATVGREIVAKYPTSLTPKIGDYAVNEEIMIKMISHVSAVSADGGHIPLKTKALIDNHCTDWQMLARLEFAMLEYNTSFFGDGKVSGLLVTLAEKLKPFLIKILTDFSAQSSQSKKPPSMN